MGRTHEVAPGSLAEQLPHSPSVSWRGDSRYPPPCFIVSIVNEGRVGCLAALLWVECSPVCTAQSDSCWHQSELALHKASPAPGRRHESPPPSLAASARPLRPAPRPAPFSARGSRLAHERDAKSGWSRRSHEGAVVAFPEAITGQAQSFASVSSASWQPSVRAQGLAAAIDGA